MSTVSFDVLSDEEIEAYVKTNDWTDKAGGYGIQCTWFLNFDFPAQFLTQCYSIQQLPEHL